jgi:hypothetical protein
VLGSTFFLIDTCCIIPMQFMLELAAERNLPAMLFLGTCLLRHTHQQDSNWQNLVIAFSR